MFENIIFDWAGTLNNNIDVAFNIFNSMFIELGKEPISKDEIRRTITIPYMKFWNHHFPDLTKEKQDELFKKHIEKYQICNLYDGVKTTLEQLYRRQVNLFIVSSDPNVTLFKDIEESKLKYLFTEIRGSVYEKDIVLNELVKKYNLNPNNTIYIGDTSGDIEAGKEAGLYTIAFSEGIQHPEILALSNPNKTISKISELLEFYK